MFSGDGNAIKEKLLHCYCKTEVAWMSITQNQCIMIRRYDDIEPNIAGNFGHTVVHVATSSDCNTAIILKLHCNCQKNIAVHP